MVAPFNGVTTVFEVGMKDSCGSVTLVTVGVAFWKLEDPDAEAEGEVDIPVKELKLGKVMAPEEVDSRGLYTHVVSGPTPTMRAYIGSSSRTSVCSSPSWNDTCVPAATSVDHTKLVANMSSNCWTMSPGVPRLI